MWQRTLFPTEKEPKRLLYYTYQHAELPLGFGAAEYEWASARHIKQSGGSYTSIGGFSLTRKRLFPVVSVGIPHRDSHVECDLAGALLRCVFLTLFSKQMTTSAKIAHRG